MIPYGAELDFAPFKNLAKMYVCTSKDDLYYWKNLREPHLPEELPTRSRIWVNITRPRIWFLWLVSIRVSVPETNSGPSLRSLPLGSHSPTEACAWGQAWGRKGVLPVVDCGTLFNLTRSSHLLFRVHKLCISTLLIYFFNIPKKIYTITTKY